MAKRPSYPEVAQVCGQLKAEGFYPPRARDILGRTGGSMTEVATHRRRWLEEQTELQSHPMECPRFVVDTIVAALIQGKKQARQEADDKIASLQHDLDDLHGYSVGLEDQITSMEEQMTARDDAYRQREMSLEKALSAEQQARKVLESEVETTRQELGNSQQELEHSRVEHAKALLQLDRADKMSETIAAREAALQDELRTMANRAAEVEKGLAVEQERGQLRIGALERSLEAERETCQRLQGELDQLREALTVAEAERVKAVTAVERAGLESRIDKLEADLRLKGGGAKKKTKPVPAPPVPSKSNGGEAQQCSSSQ